jgi:hypothetical protein
MSDYNPRSISWGRIILSFLLALLFGCGVILVIIDFIYQMLT